MPKNVQRFAWLWTLSAILAFGMIPFMPYEPGFEQAGISHLMQMVTTGLIVLILLMILFPFFWLAVWRRKNWARWTLLVLFLASLPLLLADPTAFKTNPWALTTISLGSNIVEALAFFFLFTGDARPWFANNHSQTPSGGSLNA